MSVIQTFNNVENIRVRIKTSDGSGIVKIFENNPQRTIQKLNLKAEYTTINTFIKNFQAYTDLVSLPEVGFPNFELIDGETEKLVKALEFTWGEARMHLIIWDNLDNRGWEPLATVALHNPGFYPDKKYNLLDELTDSLAYETGDNYALGVSIKDVGYGSVKATDVFIARMSYTQEVIVVNPSTDVFTNLIVNKPNSITDENIGYRVITDTVSNGNLPSGTLTVLLSSLAYQIREIIGQDKWHKVPSVTLENLKVLKDLNITDVSNVKDLNDLKALIELIEEDLDSLKVDAIVPSEIDSIFNIQWLPLQLTSNWRFWADSGTYPLQYRLMKDGAIEIRGGVQSINPPASQEIIASLPVPPTFSANQFIQSWTNSINQVVVDVLGNIRFQSGSAQIGLLINGRISTD